MNKRTGITIAAITLLELAVLALRPGRIPVASVHLQVPGVSSQASSVQTQLHYQQVGFAQKTPATGAAVNGTENCSPDQEETTEAAEDQGPDQNLPGGGHQDQGQVDHQFEGSE